MEAETDRSGGKAMIEPFASIISGAAAIAFIAASLVIVLTNKESR